jgi:aspartate/methionine/tyrosine aminotransferase
VSAPSPFSHERIPMDVLRERAFNLRWAEQPDDVVCLTAADPDFPVAPAIQEAIADYVAGGVLPYGPPEGLPGFRRAVAREMSECRGVACTADQVLAADSVASAMFVVARHVLRPGDEALVFDPVDFLFKSSTEAAGGVPVLVPFDRRTRRLDLDALERAVTPRTRLVGVCNPVNPLGVVLTREELTRIGELAVEHDLTILSDEIWSDIVFAPHEFVSIASLRPEIAARTVTISGFSKNYGLAGLRIGYFVAGSEALYDGLLATSAARLTAYGATTLSQVAAQAAYEHGRPHLDAFLAHLTAVRDYAVARLDAMDGVSCHAPEATYLLFPDVSSFGRSSAEVAAHLLAAGRVAVVPGAARWFGPGAEGHVRIAFPTSMKMVQEGLDRMASALETLR